MDIWLLIPVAALLIDGLSAFSSGADDSMWELRWRSLDAGDRARIASAGRNKEARAALKERGELDLAQGFKRRESRRRSYVQLPALLVILALTALILLGVLPQSDLNWVLSFLAMLIPVVTWLRDQQIKRAHRKALDPEAGLA